MSVESFIVQGLRETYHELGEYSFKLVLNPRRFANGHGVSLSLVDSDRKPMAADVRCWGRKVTCTFVIDGTVSDGISYVRVKNGSSEEKVLTFWVIKP